MSDRIDIVIDLETLDTEVTAQIIGIGAAALVNKQGPGYRPAGLNEVVVDVGAGMFHLAVHTGGLQRQDRTASPETIDWWKGQPERVRELYNLTAEGYTEGRHSLGAALDLFVRWYDQFEETHPGAEVYVWGNGSSFDIGILDHAMRQYGTPVPWKFWNIRDLRTIVECADLDDTEWPEFLGTKHYALDDAFNEARGLAACFTKLNYMRAALK